MCKYLLTMFVATASVMVMAFLALAVSRVEIADLSESSWHVPDTPSELLDVCTERDALLQQIKELESKNEQQRSVLQQLQGVILNQS